IAEKQMVLTPLAELAKVAALFPAEPPVTPVTQLPVAEPGPLTAINGNSTLVAGTVNPFTTDNHGFVADLNGHIVFVGGPFQPSAVNAVGPGGKATGQAQGSPAFTAPPFVNRDPWTILPEGKGGTGGAVRGGDDEWFVGFVTETGPPGEQAAAWIARR